MKSYGQYCGIARGLDLVGDRWSLLIVRDLLDGPRRYGELRDGLPGIATNLLGDRLRALVDAGVADHHPDGRYGLTPWGEELRDVLYALGRWGMPLLARPPGDDVFRSRWLRHLLAMHLGNRDADRVDATILLDVGDEPVVVTIADGRVEVTVGAPDREPDLTITGSPDAVGALVAGYVSLDAAIDRGTEVDGDATLLGGLWPAPG